MAAAAYRAAKQALKDQLLADTSLGGLSVHIDADLEALEGPTVIIFIDGRSAEAEEQSLATTRTRFAISFVLLVADVALDVAQAAAARDDLVGAVELAMIRNRTLGGKVTGLRLDGGEFFDGPGKGGGFVAWAEVRATADLTAVAE